MKLLKFIFLLATILAGLAGCVTPGGTVPDNAAELGVTFSWEGTKACSHRSPEIRVANVPAGTVELEVRLKDLDVPNWNHGGGTVVHDGSGIIPSGALKSGFNGPCPPGDRHRYEFSVKAVDAAGQVVGFGKAMRPFPPKS
jgi:phosphatidylethanolamine-binding protein (PEBP) family uncharacterized protein